MKTMYMKLILPVLAVLSLASCKKEVAGSRTGLRVAVTGEEQYNVKSQQGVSVDAFVVNIRKVTGEYDKTWVYGEMPSMIELSGGKFTVDVKSPENEPVAWNQPIYGESRNFSIIDGEITNLSLVCKIMNMKVTVVPSQFFVDSVKDYEVTVSNEDGALVWDKARIEAGDAGFFSVKPLKIKVNGIRVLDGSPVELTYKIDGNNVAPRDHHIIKVDAKVTGQAGLSLTVDHSLVDKPVDVVIPGFDDVVEGGETPGGGGDGNQPTDPEAGKPEIEWPAHPDFPVLDIEEGMDVNLIVTVPGKIKSFVVEVSENFQEAIALIAGGEKYLDLINNDTAIQNLSQIAPALPTGDRLLGMTKVDFPLSDLVPLISGVGTPGDNYVFTLKVDDEQGNNLTKSITFHMPENAAL